MRSAVGAKCPVKGKATPMENSPLVSSIWGVVGWITCDIRSQAEKPTIKVKIAMINENDFNSIVFLSELIARVSSVCISAQ
jgi:hypothetical protein